MMVKITYFNKIGNNFVLKLLAIFEDDFWSQKLFKLCIIFLVSVKIYTFLVLPITFTSIIFIIYRNYIIAFRKRKLFSSSKLCIFQALKPKLGLKEFWPFDVDRKRERVFQLILSKNDFLMFFWKVTNFHKKQTE